MPAGRVAIIGGGAIGSAVAYWLTADPAFGGEVVVVERDPGYRAASSALSASSIRQQFSTPVNIAIGLFGIGFLRGIGETLAVNGERPDIGLVEPGYLFLATGPGMATLRANHAVQVAHGADVELLTPDGLRRRYPWLTFEDLAGASHGRTGEGWFDGYGPSLRLRPPSPPAPPWSAPPRTAVPRRSGPRSRPAPPAAGLGRQPGARRSPPSGRGRAG
jgi:FAD-dependent oxidoreductase domain-containing protein 1